ncbi:MAG: 2-isopropylmalate synthase [Thioalkalivibrionaceae bacterium]
MSRSQFDFRKYVRPEKIAKPDRRWPDRVIERAPVWCSVDLRDGNQALVNPMSVEQKLRFFERLAAIGLKEIEVGFPSASQIDFDVCRRLIEEKRIPDDVRIQVLVQAREDLIRRTFEALVGVPQAIVHVYNSTNPAQREQVFRLGRDGVRGIAENGARWVAQYAARYLNTDWTFQYSPESYSQTEPDFAVEVVDAVNAIWRPDRGQKVIINLPATVEVATPNVFADQIEWFCDHVAMREHFVLSLHTHNDRGQGVAAAELGLLAGADRLEGTLFGNGERTGNMCLVTAAMNLYSQGIDPEIDLSDMAGLERLYTDCTEMQVPARHPWAGELVYTAFSGSHQDAIRKGLAHRAARAAQHGDPGPWNVPYLPIDPADIGREYEAVVRINAQSGKGGIALVLERDHGITLPKWLAQRLAAVVQAEADRSGREVDSATILRLFRQHFLAPGETASATDRVVQGGSGAWVDDYSVTRQGKRVAVSLVLTEGERRGEGDGLVDAVLRALFGAQANAVMVRQFDEHALESGTDARALAAVELFAEGLESVGVAIARDTAGAVIEALVAAWWPLRTLVSDESLPAVTVNS